MLSGLSIYEFVVSRLYVLHSQTVFTQKLKKETKIIKKFMPAFFQHVCVFLKIFNI